MKSLRNHCLLVCLLFLIIILENACAPTTPPAQTNSRGDQASSSNANKKETSDKDKDEKDKEDKTDQEEDDPYGDASSKEGANGSTDSKTKGIKDGWAQFHLLSSDQVAASVNKQVSLKPAGIIPDFMVPTLEIDYKNSDFVQVLRCAASYSLTTQTGEDIRSLQGSSTISALKWAWNQAVQDHRSCKVVATYAVAKVLPDIAAPEGEFYYIINPCVNKEHSVIRKEGCSYDIMVTKTIKFESSFKNELQAKAIELSKAESALNAEMSTAVQLAHKIEIHLKACEDMWAHKKQMLDFKKGLVQVGLIVVVGSLGNAVGGPNMAVMGAQLGMAFGSMILYSEVLGWPQDIVNECINPSVVATTKAQRDAALAAEKSSAGFMKKSHMAEYQGSFEEEFNVQALTKRFQHQLAKDGPIEKELQRVQKVMQEMKLLDQKVLSLDQAQAKLGIGKEINAANAEEVSKFLLPNQGA